MKSNYELEIEAKSVEEAIQEAVKRLHLPRERLEIKVIREEEKGLFGMPGAKLAKIKVKIKTENP